MNYFRNLEFISIFALRKGYNKEKTSKNIRLCQQRELTSLHAESVSTSTVSALVWLQLTDVRFWLHVAQRVVRNLQFHASLHLSMLKLLY